MLPKFEIGTLVSREFVPYKADESGFYREMCKRVGQASRGWCSTRYFPVDLLGAPWPKKQRNLTKVSVNLVENWEREATE